jgi:inhibitor of cysteine peptidase
MRPHGRLLSGIAVVSLLLAAAACGGDEDAADTTTTTNGDADDTTTTAGDTTTTAAPGGDTVPTTSAGDGATMLTDPATPIAVRPGGTFTITLSANPTTGFEWTIVDEPDPEVAAFSDREYTTDPGSEGRDGAGGVETLTFDAVAEGTTQVGVRYEQSFDPNPDDRTLVFSVWVQDGLPADGGPAPDPEAPPAGATFSDPSTPIAVTPGSEFGISLEANPSTGFEWVLASPLPDGTVYLGSVSQPSDSGAVGAPGTQVLVFESGQSGSGTIDLQYVRPWEAGPADETARFRLEVP